MKKVLILVLWCVWIQGCNTLSEKAVNIQSQCIQPPFETLDVRLSRPNLMPLLPTKPWAIDKILPAIPDGKEGYYRIETYLVNKGISEIWIYGIWKDINSGDNRHIMYLT